MTRKVRVGLLVDSLVVPRWAHRMVEIIQGSDYAEVVLVVRNGGTATQPPASTVQKLRDHWRSLLYIAHAKLEARIPVAEPSAFGNVDLSELLAGS